MNKLKGNTQKQMFIETLQELLEHMSPYPTKLYANHNVYNVDIDGDIVTITLPDSIINKLKEV